MKITKRSFLLILFGLLSTYVANGKQNDVFINDTLVVKAKMWHCKPIFFADKFPIEIENPNIDQLPIQCKLFFCKPKVINTLMIPFLISPLTYHDISLTIEEESLRMYAKNLPKKDCYGGEMLTKLPFRYIDKYSIFYIIL